MRPDEMMEAFVGGFGEDGPPWRGRGRGRGPGRGRRGDVRNAVLSLLRDEPMNGYQLIQAIAEKSEGLWRPGPGSIYPALGLLEDEGLIAPTETDGKKVYGLTETGTAYADEHAGELAAPWADVAGPHTGLLDVRREIAGLHLAIRQVAMTGSADQVKAARGVLDDTRKSIYRILAGDETSTQSEDTDD